MSLCGLLLRIFRAFKVGSAGSDETVEVGSSDNGNFEVGSAGSGETIEVGSSDDGTFEVGSAGSGENVEVGSSDDGTFEVGSAGSGETVQYRLRDLKMATNRFSNRNKLGKGGFGIVYKGLMNDQIIAIKRLHGSSVKLLGDVGNEVCLLSSLENDNLVKLLGFCAEAGQYLLVYEYLSNGDLHSWLTDEMKRQTLNWEKRSKIIEGIVRGLSYLHHNSENAIIHCDLKPENILLDASYNAKVTDFGLSKVFDTNRTHITRRKLAGTFGYIAPEVFSAHHYSLKSDVFSCGLLILEILIGSTIRRYAQDNNGEVLSHVVWKKWKEKRLLEVIDSSLRDECPQDQMIRCILIGLLCVQHDPKKRPEMELVLEMLNTDDSLPEPSVPAFLQEHAIPQGSSSRNEFRPTEHFRSEDSSTSVDFQPTIFPKLYSLEDLKIATDNFSCKLNKEWKGMYEVYQGLLNGQTIAVEKYSRCDISNLVRDTVTIGRKKKLKFFAVGKKNIKRDILLPDMRHPNIINILGYCLEVESKFFVVFIHPTKGSLRDFLYGQNFGLQHSEWRTRVKIIKGVANGISYLHHDLHDKYLIHGDLSPSNIWLDDSWNAKLFGFRATIVLDKEESYFVSDRVVGTMGYLAPEKAMEGILSRKTDVYSYGITLLVILVRKKPIDGHFQLDTEVWNHWQENKVLELLDPHLQNCCPEEEALRYFQIALLCIQDQHEERPTMQQVVQMLNSLDALPIPSQINFKWS